MPINPHTEWKNAHNALVEAEASKDAKRIESARSPKQSGGCRSRETNVDRTGKKREMRHKPPAKKIPRLTRVARQKRLVEMAKEVGASDDPKDFDKAFKKVTSSRPSS